jgi:hypothetical protein
MGVGIHVSRRSRPVAAVFVIAFAFVGCVTTQVGWAAAAGAEAVDEPVIRTAATAPRPCRLVVPEPLRNIVDDAWRLSETFRSQCRELADAGAVVVLTLRARFGRGAQADTAMGVDAAGVVIATVSVPLDSRTVELIAHELEHVVEHATGANMAEESRRRGSGVWRTFGGFETQRAIDTGRRVACETREGAARNQTPDARR